MKTVHLPLTELELIAVTRALLGVGIGLLVGEYLTKRTSNSIGWLLVAIGGLSTIPLACDVFGHRTSSGLSFDQPSLVSLVKR